MQKDTYKELQEAIEKMCKRFDMDVKWFRLVEGKGKPHTLYLKGRYLTTQEALFALNRWKSLVKQFWFHDLRIKAKVVTRKNYKFITMEGIIGEAPPC